MKISKIILGHVLASMLLLVNVFSAERSYRAVGESAIDYAHRMGVELNFFDEKHSAAVKDFVRDGFPYCTGLTQIVLNAFDSKEHQENKYYPICSQGQNRSQTMYGALRWFLGISQNRVCKALSLDAGPCVFLREDLESPLFTSLGVNQEGVCEEAGFQKAFGAKVAFESRKRACDEEFLNGVAAIINYTDSKPIKVVFANRYASTHLLQIYCSSDPEGNPFFSKDLNDPDVMRDFFNPIVDAARNAFDNYVAQTLAPLPNIGNPDFSGKHVFLIMLDRTSTEIFCTLLMESLERQCRDESTLKRVAASIKIMSLGFADPLPHRSKYLGKAISTLTEEQKIDSWQHAYEVLGARYARMLGAGFSDVAPTAPHIVSSAAAAAGGSSGGVAASGSAVPPVAPHVVSQIVRAAGHPTVEYLKAGIHPDTMTFSDEQFKRYYTEAYLSFYGLEEVPPLHGYVGDASSTGGIVAGPSLSAHEASGAAEDAEADAHKIADLRAQITKLEEKQAKLIGEPTLSDERAMEKREKRIQALGREIRALYMKIRVIETRHRAGAAR
jgi:hypothetical protein